MLVPRGGGAQKPAINLVREGQSTPPPTDSRKLDGVRYKRLLKPFFGPTA